MSLEPSTEERKRDEAVATANVGNAIDALVFALKQTRYPGVIGQISDALGHARQAHAIMQDCKERDY